MFPFETPKRIPAVPRVYEVVASIVNSLPQRLVRGLRAVANTPRFSAKKSLLNPHEVLI